MWRAWLVLMAVCCIAPSVSARVRVPGVFSDHAVVQRGIPFRVWGLAEPGEVISITFNRQRASVTTSEQGFWEIHLQAEQAGGPYILQISGDRSTEVIRLTDILVGDVWFAGGQSNMEMPLLGFPGSHSPVAGAERQIEQADLPKVRLFAQRRRVAMAPAWDSDDRWVVSTPESAATFSAIAHVFARRIAEQQDVPVGIIAAPWGGTPAQTWVSAEGLAWANVASVPLDTATIMREQGIEDAALAARDLSSRSQDAAPFRGHLSSWLPSACYNGMIAPFTRYTIKGWLWYQGETDANPPLRPQNYSRLFQGLIQDWRRQWGQGALPFLYIQLADYGRAPQGWGLVRDAQRRALALVNTGMVVAADLGQADNIHPAAKIPLGERLARLAEDMVYGAAERGISPQFRSATLDGGAIRAWFDHARRLTLRGSHTVEGVEIAGDDGRFVPAVARIEQVDGQPTLVASATEVPAPLHIRYAWQPWTTSYLDNEAGLPLGTFTSQSDAVLLADPGAS